MIKTVTQPEMEHQQHQMAAHTDWIVTVPQQSQSPGNGLLSNVKQHFTI